MPRQRRSSAPRSTPSRPTAPAPRAPASQQQNRSMTTTAAPTTARPQAPAQGQQGQGSGLFGQMASTAAGVAVGSSIGHAIGGFFGGGSQAPMPEQTQSTGVEPQTESYNSNSWGAANCEGSAMQFTKCMDDNAGNMQICNWYLEQLKACQAAAKQY